ncbi:TPA: ATP phosphoribosyltransferase [Candidatus Woesearchaeota archaeon]|nr:ATP phosphoribosyltransferase [Candidatus Woesearchaeota archaeon]HIH49030.1 ATP phosphoribosyltransferase [Candidatus Woesearchaeota archaeon]HIJ03033.1 ATP phosphoribosyltransferase [Candidatus Woesearchaeota archaeon]
MTAVIVFIVIPKNTGLKQYTDIALGYLTEADPKNMIEVRGEDVPSWVVQLRKKGKKAIGLTGEDLYREYVIEERETTLQVVRKIRWADGQALFGKPALCLIGPKGMTIDNLPREATVCIAAKYPKIAKRYLNLLEGRGFSFKKIYMNGSVESSYTTGIADILIDIVYTGNSLKKYGLVIIDVILYSDFVIIGGKND